MAHPITAFFDQGLQIPEHDYQVRSGGTNNHGSLMIEYYRGGAPEDGGELLATEKLTYDEHGNVLTRGVYWEPWGPPPEPEP